MVHLWVREERAKSRIFSGKSMSSFDMLVPSMVGAIPRSANECHAPALPAITNSKHSAHARRLPADIPCSAPPLVRNQSGESWEVPGSFQAEGEM
mmetsp:Transcript_21380/g.49583  ORF Transcript_21380/g.49583 Transcript_21380/m.49583 type:complete len:95 (-) Transcript_21380:19-303(-)